MRRSPWTRYALAATLAITAALPVAVSADEETGGAPLPRTPAAAPVTCADGGAPGCPEDDAGVGSARVQDVPPEMRPAAAARPAPAPAQAAFPIDGEHTYGRSGTNGFGGGRGHQGHDVFAECGTPLVAAGGGTVLTATFEANAGNYVVIQRANGRSNVYMHLRDPARVAEGEKVAAGDALGVVGQTGRASACHLHFEVWTAPGWYRGGRAIDPLATLRRWDAA